MHAEYSLNNAPCFFFCCAENGTLVFINEPLCSALGYTNDELSDKKVETIFTLATRIFYQTHLFPLLKLKGNTQEIYITLKTKDNREIPVLLNAEKINALHATYTYAAIVVRNRKKFEEELIAAKKAAETALNENIALNEAKNALQLHIKQLDQQMFTINKQNEELRQFNHVITHSLQEPLRKLSVFSDMLQLTHEKQDLQKTASKLLRVLAQMHDVVTGLQQYVWLSEAALSAVDINTVVAQCLLELQKEYADVKLCIDSDALPVINADKDQMHLLFHEILSNAIKFRKQENNACIKINAAALKMNKFKNVSEKYEYTEFIKIEITDKGIGFKNEYNEQVFQLFRKLHNKPGKGIGLALCKKIVENHNGSISINSDEDKHTIVEVYLPIAALNI